MSVNVVFFFKTVAGLRGRRLLAEGHAAVDGIAHGRCVLGEPSSPGNLLQETIIKRQVTDVWKGIHEFNYRGGSLTCATAELQRLFNRLAGAMQGAIQEVSVEHPLEHPTCPTHSTHVSASSFLRRRGLYFPLTDRYAEKATCCICPGQHVDTRTFPTDTATLDTTLTPQHCRKFPYLIEHVAAPTSDQTQGVK